MSAEKTANRGDIYVFSRKKTDSQRGAETSFQWKEMVTTAKIGVHRLMSLVVCLEAMLQNIQKQKPQGKPGKLG